MVATIRPKTPGVYVQEIATLPPSVADVATAVPAFIGYTERGYMPDGDNVVRISTLLEYESIFGKAAPTPFTVTLGRNGNGDRAVRSIVPSDGGTTLYQLYYSLSLYFSNGGGPCYIVSIGDYETPPEKPHFVERGLALLEKEDEPTLILFPDAVNLSASDFYDVCNAALSHAAAMKDRFCILDVLSAETLAESITNFRNGISGQPETFKYGAAYSPYLNSSVPYRYEESSVTVALPWATPFGPHTFTANGIAVTYVGAANSTPQVIVREGEAGDPAVEFAIDAANLTLTIDRDAASTGEAIANAWQDWVKRNPAQGFAISAQDEGTALVDVTAVEPVALDQQVATAAVFGPHILTPGAITVTYTGEAGDAPKVIVEEGGTVKAPRIVVNPESHTLTITRHASTTGTTIVSRWESSVSGNARGGFAIAVEGNGEAVVNLTPAEGMALTQSFTFVRTFTANGIAVTYTGGAQDAPKVMIVEGASSGAEKGFEVKNGTLTITRPPDTTGNTIAGEWTTWVATNAAGGFAIAAAGNGEAVVAVTDARAMLPATLAPLASYQATDTILYNMVKAALTQKWVTLPPSPAVAGVYASVDRTRGVWKAPANVSLTGVIAPATKITVAQQDDMNVDPTAGKSINAIRAFTGKGTMIWGARTLAGNDNEWRYINVRRLFNLIEESIQKATAFAVFEANDATTWLKVKSMIDSYLFGLWEQGALAGPTPAAAYFVNVGLGKTMTPQDILEGRMIVRVGVAAVRPAEYIIVEFTHKLQEA